jgi:hypothetical protein
MEVLARPATWLEMAGAPQWRSVPPKIRIHPVVGPEGACFALTLDARWLCDTQGRVTLFHTLGAAVRFLQLAQVHDFEAGEPCDLGPQASGGVECLGVRRGKGSLQPCTQRGPGCLAHKTGH